MSKFIEARPVDEEFLMISWQDGIIEYKEDGTGPGAYMGHETGGGDEVRRFDPGLDTVKASDPASFSLVSADDPAYLSPRKPVNAYRKTKVNGTTREYPEPAFTLEHSIFLKLPARLRQGCHYKLIIDPAVNSDAASADFEFDVFKHVSEAIHVNIIGYNPDFLSKNSADLYMWLADGGSRDYSGFEGRPVILFDVETGLKREAGKVVFWKKSGPDFGGRNLTKTDVWNCDFSGSGTEGTFRLAIEGIGCSPDFRLSREIFYEPFKTSIRGFFYMRIGASPDIIPVPRQPRFIPGVDPKNFRVYLTTFGPWHPDWKKIKRDVWDVTDWSMYKEPGEPVNPDAWGGHSDACDWDRNPNHVSIIWDILLPYLLTNGRIGDDDLDIPESGNGIPDLIDEARYEVDFWLRLRDTRGGYSSGTNNPDRNDHSLMYQAAAKPYMAWVSAANAAMLADCFRVAGKPDLMEHYMNASLEAWKIADEQDLEVSFGIGNTVTRGRDLKMMAAGFLYNITGDRKYEDVMAAESVCVTSSSEIDRKGQYCQYWATAGYLMCAKFGWQAIHYPDLLENMRQSIVNEALGKNAANTDRWPSRRSSDTVYGHFQSTQAVQLLCIAHAASSDTVVREKMLRAMILESDYGLGRNPLNMVHMTGLGSRHVEDIYTTGRNDGTPGVHPGHTPYMNAEAWGTGGGYQSDPQWYANRGYPEWAKWPHGEALWRARYCYANNEFTPQQTMRGKTCVLGYLYALGDRHKTEK